MRLSAVIMAHPERKDIAERTANSLDRPVEIIYDQNPVPSTDPVQRWENGKRCWQAAEPWADWHLVLQDDAMPCQDLLAGTEKALEQLGPDGLVSIYSGAARATQTHVSRAQRHADAHGLHWYSTRSLNWGVGIVLPTHAIEGMLEWCSRDEVSQDNYDKRIGVYCRDRLWWRTWYLHPSLVDHDQVPSLVGHAEGRHADRMHMGSALDIDWSRVPSTGLSPRLKAGPQ